MKNSILSIFLMLIILASAMLLTGCNNKSKESENVLDPNKEYAQIYISDNGSTLNHKTYVILDEDILKFKTTDSDEEDEKKYKDVEGYTTSIKYYFEGIKEGKTEIWVVDMFPGQIERTTKYEISVDSNLNAKIISSSDDNVRRNGGLIMVEDYEGLVIDIADNSIVRKVDMWRTPNNINFVGLKEGSTTISIKEKSGEEKHYKVNVDENLNVVMVEM